MRISAVRVYRQVQPFRTGSYGTWGGTSEAFDSVVVALESDEGVVGWGEMAPLGSFYSPAFAAGARAGVAELAPHLLGLDPGAPPLVHHRLDEVMNGHPYVKSAIDIACWDLAGRASGRPLCDLVGGRHGESVPLYRAIPSASRSDVVEAALAYVSEGYRRLQLKVGGAPDRDFAVVHAVREAVSPDVAVFVDANGAWSTGDALRFLRLSRELDIDIEQPCRSHPECAAIRGSCKHPMILDEGIDSLASLLAAHQLGIADGVTIKLSRVGGITPALLLRDVAVSLGIPVTVEDTGGASIDTAAMLHVAISTPERLRIHTCDFNAWVTVDNATGLPAPEDGRIRAPTDPGLGIEVDVRSLGEPFLEVSGRDTSSATVRL